MKKIKAIPQTLTPAKQATDSTDILLNHCDHSDCEHPLSHVTDKNELEARCVIKNIGLNTPFFYQVDQYKKKEVVFRERGIGRILSDERGVKLSRDIVLEVQHEKSSESAAFGVSPHNFGDNPLTVGSFVPNKINTTYPFVNSIFTSEGVIILEENEFLMADTENGFFGATVEDLIKLIVKNKTGFQAPSIKPKKPKQGTIIFNKATKKFEGYDGKGWIEL